MSIEAIAIGLLAGVWVWCAQICWWLSSINDKLKRRGEQ